MTTRMVSIGMYRTALTICTVLALIAGLGIGHRWGTPSQADLEAAKEAVCDSCFTVAMRSLEPDGTEGWADIWDTLNQLQWLISTSGQDRQQIVESYSPVYRRGFRAALDSIKQEREFDPTDTMVAVDPDTLAPWLIADTLGEVDDSLIKSMYHSDGI